MVLLLCLILIAAASVYALPLNDTPVYLSPDQNNTKFFNHGEPNMVCTDYTARSIVLFLAINYLAHCATVNSYPGENLLISMLTRVLALFFPGSGVLIATNSLIRRSRLYGSSAIESATRAGALCMVTRNKYWQPAHNDTIHAVELPKHPDRHQNETNQSPAPDSDRNYTYEVYKPEWAEECLPNTDFVRETYGRMTSAVHGFCDLPRGYSLTIVPSDAKVEAGDPECKATDLSTMEESAAELELRANSIGINSSRKGTGLADNYNAAQALIGLIQAISSGITLYHARGSQISTYGYSAFGLTVVPYLIMSIVNLLGQLLCSQYPKLYMVWSPEMSEARSRCGQFHGVIGQLCPVPAPNTSTVTLKRIPETSDKEKKYGIFLDATRIERPRTPQDSIGDDPWGNLLVHEKKGIENNTVLKIMGHVVKDTIRELIALRGLRTSSSAHQRKTVLIPTCSHFELQPSRMRYQWMRTIKGLSGSSKTMPGNAYEATRLKKLPLVSRVAIYAPLLVSLGVALAVIGSLSAFRANESTRAQRGWTMSWLAVGEVYGIIVPFMVINLVHPIQRWKRGKRTREKLLLLSSVDLCTFIIFWGLLFSPAIGGFVVVIQMLKEYGDCVHV